MQSWISILDLAANVIKSHLLLNHICFIEIRRAATFATTLDDEQLQNSPFNNTKMPTTIEESPQTKVTTLENTQYQT